MACYNPNDLSPDELSCPICFEEFAIHSSSERSPKLLLCLHTFCLGCIRNLVQSNKTIQCSICRTEHKDVSPLELFDNYVIVDFIKKQQEESDALLARQHSLADGPHFTADYQQRQHQVESDAEYARKIQSHFDEHPNIEPEGFESEPVCMEYTAAAPCVEAVREKAVPPVAAQCVAFFKPGRVSNPPELATASTSQASAGAYCRSSSVPLRPSRSVTPDTSASSSTTPSSSTTSSNGTTSTTSSDATSSDDRCSSQASASSRLDDEYVDSVDVIDTPDERIASEVAGTAEANVSGSTAPSLLSATHTDNSSFFSSDSPPEDARTDYGSDGDDDEEDNDLGLICGVLASDLEEDGAEDTTYVVLEEQRNDSDVSNMDTLEVFGERVIDDETPECIDVDEGAVAPQVDEAESDHWESQEDELFNNFNVLESRQVDRVENTDFSGATQISGSSESEDSCADVPPVVDMADEESLDSVLASVNNPEDDRTGSTITLDDTVESVSDSVVLLNEYNGVLTRSATSKLRKSNPDLRF